VLGIILGVVVGIGVVQAAGSGTLALGSFVIFIALGLLGLLFARTVGMMFTTVSVASAIAVIVALATGHGSSALAALLIGLVTFAGQFLIVNVRRDAT
jgi:hypothetical protein